MEDKYNCKLMRKATILTFLALWCCIDITAQHYFNLTAEEVKIDNRMPIFNYSFDLGFDYPGYDYDVEIVYPQFIDILPEDTAKISGLWQEPINELPVVNKNLSVSRKRGQMDIWLMPVVKREGRYQKMVSFGLNLISRHRGQRAAMRAGETAAERYAANSILREGKWAKISVKETGVHQITSDLVKKAGFSDINKVKVYGYGGAMQPERLTGAYLIDTDDLKEVPTCNIGGRRLFYAQGTVTWSSNGTRTRNPYSDYGYYFLTESEGEPLMVDSAEFVKPIYSASDSENDMISTWALYEVDDFAWFSGGRNLYDSKLIESTTPAEYNLNLRSNGKGTLVVALTADAATSATISVNDSVVTNLSISNPGSFDAAMLVTRNLKVDLLDGNNKVTISRGEGNAKMRLDYISLSSEAVVLPPALSSYAFPTPEYVYNITNQNHHADPIVDMVILIPTTQKFRKYAEQLADFHRNHDGMTVNIVPADELYNEFSSGTPDATAYRRYMKMLYDRASTPDEAPKYLLLFGDCAWDNRMLLSDWKRYSPDDFLLCFESENSLNDVSCFVSDDFFCMLDDGEQIQVSGNYNNCTGKPDVAVGRLPIRNESDAKTLVNKIIEYVENPNPGTWQNTVVVMGDDGNNNAHMQDADNAAKVISRCDPSIDVRKIMWDAYKMEKSSTGNTFPDARNLILGYMNSGALLMNYSGHGNPTQLSHETVLKIGDFEKAESKSYSVWITAACDVVPMDGLEDNIGEIAMLNPNGGAIAFFGTARTVYQLQNSYMNQMFCSNLFSKVDGKRVSIGEAVRLAKDSLASTYTATSSSDLNYRDLSANKLQYVLIGDPALMLKIPETKATVDSINGKPLVSGETVNLRAGDVVKMSGSVADDTFNGTLTAMVRGASEHIVCRLQNTSSDGAEVAFEYDDRTSVIYRGNNTVKNGKFDISFIVPKDIKYSDGEGQVMLFADDGEGRQYNGISGGMVFNGTGELPLDSIGPSVFCYLNSTTFADGDKVNTTPYFMAELYDESGINATGTGIGHDLVLTIDDDPQMSYTLNDYFSFDFGSYQRGMVGYQMPELTEGKHTLQFRSWDVFNNSSVARLQFEVIKGLSPKIFNIRATDNPVRGKTTFVVQHDRAGSQIDVVVDIIDMSGRVVASRHVKETTPTNTSYVTWNVATDGGAPLHTGIYLYRAKVISDGGTVVTKAQKIVVLSNK